MRAQDADPAEVTIGERLFLETRFAEFFARNATGVNDPLAAGDPVVATTQTASGAALPGPFAGESMNCRSCHFVDEHLGAPGGGMRTYTDFARRSPVPARADGKLVAARNSPPLVNASLEREGATVFHFDGEFPSLPALVRGTLTGRNFGWLPGEAGFAVAHIARVIREDDGSGALAQGVGGAYRIVLAGVDASLPPELVLPPGFRIDVDRANDDEVVDAVARLVAAYVEQLVFAQDDDGDFVGSPFDTFLARNGLPRAPREGESPVQYTNRLRGALARLASPVFVNDGPFEFHARDRVFGPSELQGLQIFLRTPVKGKLKKKQVARGGFGNCVACHPAPTFTDFSFHNTGVTQLEYEAVHGAGSFAALAIPSLADRNADPNRWLPASGLHPNAAEPFRSPPSAAQPGRTDLGAWNVIGNLDLGDAQEGLSEALCERALARLGDPEGAARARAMRIHCNPRALLDQSVAVFKTPGLRDLLHSGPYFHSGGIDTLDGVVAQYRQVGELQRAHALRNGAPELAGIALAPADLAPLAAFLRSLSEDYN